MNFRDLTDETKLIIVGIVILIVLYYLYNRKSTSTSMNKMSEKTESMTDVNNEYLTNTEGLTAEEINDAKLRNKMLSINSARNGKYKVINYADGDREAQSDNLDKFFEGNYPTELNNDNFTPFNPPTNDQYSTYVPGKLQRPLSDKEKFNLQSLLPSEKNSDWFDDPYKTDIQSSHLINIYRPVGVNTIQTTLKNPSHDLRGTVPNPKYVVSPWMNSSYEPDTNIQGQMLC